MNKSIGFRRLAIFIAVPYFGYWLIRGIYWYNKYTYFGHQLAVTNDYAYRNYQINAEMEVIASIGWGALAPLLAALVLSAILWVYRGFKPNP